MKTIDTTNAPAPVASAAAAPQRQAPLPASYTFTHDGSLAPYTVPMETYLSSPPAGIDTSTYKFLATGVCVFRDSRVLLLQRAAHDSMPNRWEVPGGAVDLDDPSILYGAAREVFEEAGVKVGHFDALVGDPAGQVFKTRSGNQVCKLTWATKLARRSDGEWEKVKISEEHQDFVWATEEECRAKKVARVGETGRGKEGDVVEIVFTTKDQEKIILQAFEARSERMHVANAT